MLRHIGHGPRYLYVRLDSVFMSHSNFIAKTAIAVVLLYIISFGIAHKYDELHSNQWNKKLYVIYYPMEMAWKTAVGEFIIVNYLHLFYWHGALHAG